MDQGYVVARSSPFIPRSDDDDNLWKVHEITQESGAQYKVRWVGTDPETGKPWKHSWVAKSDCTDDLVKAWEAKRWSRSYDDSEGGRPLLKRKREPQPDGGVVGPAEDLGEGFETTAKAKPGFRKKRGVVKDAPPNACLGSPPLLKVGPPRGVPKNRPVPDPPRSVRSTEVGRKGEESKKKDSALAPFEQKPSALECQPSSSHFPAARPGWKAVTPPASELSGTSGKPEPSKKALGDLTVQFTSIAANILKLHGLVKKVDLQLEAAMRELRELEASLQ